MLKHFVEILSHIMCIIRKINKMIAIQFDSNKILKNQLIDDIVKIASIEKYNIQSNNKYEINEM